MTKGEVRAELDAAILAVSGKNGIHHPETRMSAISQDSLETIELLIALEIAFDRTFDSRLDGKIHAGTYGELLDFLCRAMNVTGEKI